MADANISTFLHVLRAKNIQLEPLPYFASIHNKKGIFECETYVYFIRFFNIMCLNDIV